MDNPNTRKIMIIDDHKKFRKLLKVVIGDHFPNLEILEASASEDILTLIAAYQPALVIQELDLNRIRGLELTRQIRSRLSNAVIAVMTSCDLPEYEAAAFQNGANYFISKSEPNGQRILEVVEASLV